MRVNICVSGVETKTFDNGGKKYNVLDGKKKYGFYDVKKDGQPTKAYEGFDQLKIRVGDHVEAEVEEEERTFEDTKTGKTVNYTDRRVLYFYTDEKASSAPQAAGKVVSTDLASRVTELERWRASVDIYSKKPAVIEPSFPSEAPSELPTIDLSLEEQPPF